MKALAGHRSEWRSSEASLMAGVHDDGWFRFEGLALECSRTRQILEFAAIGIYLVPRQSPLPARLARYRP
jgi:hypothetical protein